MPCSTDLKRFALQNTQGSSEAGVHVGAEANSKMALGFSGKDDVRQNEGKGPDTIWLHNIYLLLSRPFLRPYRARRLVGAVPRAKTPG